MQESIEVAVLYPLILDGFPILSVFFYLNRQNLLFIESKPGTWFVYNKEMDSKRYLVAILMYLYSGRKNVTYVHSKNQRNLRNHRCLTTIYANADEVPARQRSAIPAQYTRQCGASPIQAARQNSANTALSTSQPTALCRLPASAVPVRSSLPAIAVQARSSLLARTVPTVLSTSQEGF